MAETTNPHIPTIVYVEDNTGDAVLLEEALREHGHAIHLLVIPDGAKALHYFRVKESARDLPPPHCILLDENLPVITGSELLRFIRGSRVYDGTPVYIFSDHTEYSDLVTGEIISRNSFIRKPGRWEEFLQLSDLLMASARAKRELPAPAPLNRTGAA